MGQNTVNALLLKSNITIKAVLFSHVTFNGLHDKLNMWKSVGQQ